MSDVRMYQTPDDGDISVENGVMAMDGGMYTATYLSLFGAIDWWGNGLEQDINKQLKSRTMQVLEGYSSTSANLAKVEDAVRFDLAWLGSDFEVTVSIPQLNRIKIQIDIDGTTIELQDNWGGFVSAEVVYEDIAPDPISTFTASRIWLSVEEITI